VSERVRQDILLAGARDHYVPLSQLWDQMRLMSNALRGAAASNWAYDRFSCGSYSHARIGHASSRAELALAVDNRFFFAGEATSPTFFSTAHGAYDSGLRSAAEVMRSFPRSMQRVGQLPECAAAAAYSSFGTGFLPPETGAPKGA
jgi:hypothetical protein